MLTLKLSSHPYTDYLIYSEFKEMFVFYACEQGHAHACECVYMSQREVGLDSDTADTLSLC